MITRRQHRFFAGLLAVWATALLVKTAAAADDIPGEKIEAVSGRVSPDYVRTKLADGSFQPETYAFGKGGYWSGNRKDDTIDKMGFMDVATIIAGPLQKQKYIPAKDPKATKLMIMVYWGTTRAPEHASDSNGYKELADANQTLNQLWPEHLQHDLYGNSKLPPANDLAAWRAFDEQSTAIAMVQAENRMRDNEDRRNATMLGYDSWWDATYNAQNGTPLEVRKQDMINELEGDRYFVVLMAYDFQLMWKQKKTKLLWETRFSISEHKNQFDKQLESMALEASRYFGQDSGGLTHASLPEGRVELGDVRSLGVVPEK
jgi:hypothetical protein